MIFDHLELFQTLQVYDNNFRGQAVVALSKTNQITSDKKLSQDNVWLKIIQNKSSLLKRQEIPKSENALFKKSMSAPCHQPSREYSRISGFPEIFHS
jgi:hypothetical protein